QITWIKLADSAARYYATGFTNQLGALASPYVQPTGAGGKLLSFGAPLISFTGGNLAPDFSNSLSIGPYGRTLNLRSNSLTMIFSLADGTFRGNVVDPASGQ